MKRRLVFCVSAILSLTFLAGCGGVSSHPNASVSSTSYNFGDALVGSTTTQTVTTIDNTGNVTLTLSPTVSGDPSFSIVSSGGCAGQLAPGATCEVQVQYAPTVASNPSPQTATVTLGISPLPGGVAGTVTVTGTSGAVSGTVTNTANAMVASYSLSLPFPGTWSVAFGLNTNYGRTTNTVTVATGGTAASVFVAGMLPNTTYHMRATAVLTNGSAGSDVDHTFATGGLPTGIPATLPVTVGTGTPQPGIELLNPIVMAIPTTVFASDLEGNTIWAYQYPDRVANSILYPPKLLPNGNFMVMISPNSYPLDYTGSYHIREIDLAGDTIHDLTMSSLNAALAAGNFGVPTLVNFSHDFLALPNGHLLFITNTSVPYTGLIGYSGTVNVVGDVVVDLDENWNPVWTWSTFDHLNVNRHPWTAMFPDWTHANSLSYSTDDGNFIISLRHQNWVVKVDYQNGAGAGDILWYLGEGGNFSLVGGVDPTDWFYAQHDVTYATQNTTGVYSLTLMDNGDDRIFASGVTCGTAGQPPCLYSTVQELQIDETAMTATFQSHQILPTSLYSFFGGNAELLSNGDFEYMLAGLTAGSQIFEVTPGSEPQTVWNMTMPGTWGYRGFRQPSLYPGVQWEQ
jgi:arylsulfate sulfotransferase